MQRHETCLHVASLTQFMSSLMWSDKLIFLEQGHHLQAAVSNTCSAKFSRWDKSSLWPKWCSCRLFRKALTIIKHFFYIPSVRRCL